MARINSSLHAILIAGAASVVGSVPMFITGALAVEISDELAFGTVALGAAIAVFPATSAAAAGFMGRLADTKGSVWSLRVAVAVAGGAAVGIAATAYNWATLVAWLVIASFGRSLAQPAANRVLITNVRPERQGAAFGLKQSAAPVSSMLAGLSLPVVALTLGWRWAYALTAVLAMAVALVVRRLEPHTGRAQRAQVAGAKLRDRGTILLLAIAFGLGNFASSVVPAFYVITAVEAGSSPQFAGALLAFASIASIGIRLASGIACDRIGSNHLRLCAALLVGGSLGLVLLAFRHPGLMAVGAVVALAGTWGFPAVFWFAVVRAHAEAPGRITGAILPGGLVGATVGPLVFGIVADRFDDAWAWLLACCLSVLGAVVLASCSGRLDRLPRDLARAVVS